MCLYLSPVVGISYCLEKGAVHINPLPADLLQDLTDSIWAPLAHGSQMLSNKFARHGRFMTSEASLPAQSDNGSLSRDRPQTCERGRLRAASAANAARGPPQEDGLVMRLPELLLRSLIHFTLFSLRRKSQRPLSPSAEAPLRGLLFLCVLQARTPHLRTPRHMSHSLLFIIPSYPLFLF